MCLSEAHINMYSLSLSRTKIPISSVKLISTTLLISRITIWFRDRMIECVWINMWIWVTHIEFVWICLIKRNWTVFAMWPDFWFAEWNVLDLWIRQINTVRSGLCLRNKGVWWKRWIWMNLFGLDILKIRD